MAAINLLEKGVYVRLAPHGGARIFVHTAKIARSSKLRTPMDIRDTITFVVQKTFSITIGVLGALRVTSDPPSETSLAVAQIIVGGLMLTVAATVEMMMWRARVAEQRQAAESGNSSNSRLADRMEMLERALIERLPPTIP